MTVPQRSAAIKALLVPFLLLASVHPAPAEDGDNRQPLFSCGTDPVDDAGFLDLSGIPADNGSWVDLRFERKANGTGDTVYSYPQSGPGDRTAFLFSHSDGPGGYLVSIRWTDAATNYVYYSLAIPPDPATEDDAGGGSAGLVISRNGKLVEAVDCTERPYMFISYMRAAMSCDLANPYGEAACAEDPYGRSEAIDPETLGIVP